jgi:hypothetical protein
MELGAKRAAPEPGLDDSKRNKRTNEADDDADKKTGANKQKLERTHKEINDHAESERRRVMAILEKKISDLQKEMAVGVDIKVNIEAIKIVKVAMALLSFFYAVETGKVAVIFFTNPLHEEQSLAIREMEGNDYQLKDALTDVIENFIDKSQWKAFIEKVKVDHSARWSGRTDKCGRIVVFYGLEKDKSKTCGARNFINFWPDARTGFLDPAIFYFSPKEQK